MSLDTPRAGDILVVDDTPANLRVLVDLLSKEGYRVRPAISGPLALRAARAAPPDLVLLDVMMPGMDGFAVCRELKAAEETREIPVIFLSAVDETLNKVSAFSLGAVDYITKPFQAEEVFARINTHLTLARLQRQQRDLFQRFATKEVVDELMERGFALGGQLVKASVLFADIRSYTTIAEAQTPVETIEFLNQYFSHMLGLIGGEGGVVNHIAGDGLMALFGAPVAYADHASRAARAALKMQERVGLINAERRAAGRAPIQIGVGIASGEVIAGIVGTEFRATYTCVGDTVNTAARLEGCTKELRRGILIDERTRNELDPAIPVTDEGPILLRGKAHEIRVFSISEGRDEE